MAIDGRRQLASSCPAGTYFQSPFCYAVKTCAAGTFEIVAPTSTSDRQCSVHTICNNTIEYTKVAGTAFSDTVCAAKTCDGGAEVQELSLLTFVDMLMHENAREPASLAGRVRGRLHKQRAADSGYTNVEPLADQPNAQSLYQEHLRSIRAGMLDDLSESTKPLPLGVSKMLGDLRSKLLLPDATIVGSPSQI